MSGRREIVMPKAVYLGILDESRKIADANWARHGSTRLKVAEIVRQRNQRVLAWAQDQGQLAPTE